MKRTITVAIFALLAVTTPARAAYVDSLGASVDLQFGPGQELTGTFDLAWLPVGFGGASCCRVNDYYFSDTPNLSLNRSPLSGSGLPGPNAMPYGGTTIGIFHGPTLPTLPGYDLAAFGVNTDFLPPNPTFANFLINGSPATSGTVTVNSETLATPLPAAFPLFASALAGLGGFGWLKRKGKVSRPDRN